MSEWLGWIATGVFTSSYLFKRANALRLVQMIAALMWIGYGVPRPRQPGHRRQPPRPRSRRRGYVVGAQLSRRLAPSALRDARALLRPPGLVCSSSW